MACSTGNKLRLAWYETAIPAVYDATDARWNIPGGGPAYQNALEAYRAHRKVCEECKLELVGSEQIVIGVKL